MGTAQRKVEALRTWEIEVVVVEAELVSVRACASPRRDRS